MGAVVQEVSIPQHSRVVPIWNCIAIEGGIDSFYRGHTAYALARMRGDAIGIVFQSFHLVPTMTALENVALPLEFTGREEPFERARAALGDVGLAHREDHFPAQLSGGEQQRVALARAMAPRPSLLLADEPTGNLDGATGREVMDLIFDLHTRHGTTLVLVTHDERLAARCKRVLHMRDGLLGEAPALEPAGTAS